MNGVYLPAGQCDGVPQYVNANGVTLLRYRFKKTGRAFWSHRTARKERVFLRK